MNTIKNWLIKNSLVLFCISACLVMGITILQLVDISKSPSEIGEVKGVQHHLVWDVNGVCYFVRPNNSKTNYLIPVPDCNKK